MWVVVVSEHSSPSVVYGPFASKEVADATAAGINMMGGSGSTKSARSLQVTAP